MTEPLKQQPEQVSALQIGTLTPMHDTLGNLFHAGCCNGGVERAMREMEDYDDPFKWGAWDMPGRWYREELKPGTPCSTCGEALLPVRQWPPSALSELQFCHELEQAVIDACNRMNYASFPTGSVVVETAKRVLNSTTLSDEQRGKLLRKAGQEAWSKHRDEVGL